MKVNFKIQLLKIFRILQLELIELVPDLVWILAPKTPENPDFDDHVLLRHKIPKFPTKFLNQPAPQIDLKEVSIIWTAVIIAIIHLLFDFVR